MTTVFMLAGAFGSPDTGPYAMPLQLSGELTASNTLVPVVYNNFGLDFVSEGADGAAKIDAAINGTSGARIVFGHSLGAVSISRWLHDYGPTSTVPTSGADAVSFVQIGDSTHRYTGFLRLLGIAGDATIPTGTPYSVTCIANQYDGWADFPNQNTSPSYFTAAVNAFAGQSIWHDYKLTSYNKAVDGTYPYHVDGNVRYVWAPSFPVPLLGQPAPQPQPTNPVGDFVAGIQRADMIGVYPGPLVPTTRGGLAILPSSVSSTPLIEADQQWRPQIEDAYNRPVAIPNPY